jgi:hypothetical protein
MININPRQSSHTDRFFRLAEGDTARRMPAMGNIKANAQPPIR